MILSFFVISLFSSIGLAILLVEKGEDWPVELFSGFIKSFLTGLGLEKMANMFECTVCTSFWTSLFVDFIILIITGGQYFLWPLTGFAACGITWILIEFLNILDNLNE